MPIIVPAPPAGAGLSLRLVGGTTSALDLTTFLNAQEGEGLDPADGSFLEPVFNDSPIGDGQGLVNIDTHNKELVWPLHLTATSKDALHDVVRQLRRKLDEPDVLVEWRDHGSTDVTYYDLEYGRFEAGYRFFRARQNWLSGNLHCWVRPYGHTATERIVGTGAGSGFLQMISAPNIAGDAPALMVCEISATGAQELYGVTVVPSGVLTEWRAASISILNATSTLVGASGAVGSQYRGIHVATPAVDAALIYVPQASMVGDQRIFAIARTPNLGGMNLSLRNTGTPSVVLGPTAFLSATYALAPYGDTPTSWNGWQLVDLGVMRMPPSKMRPATAALALSAAMASSAAPSLIASPGLHLAALYVMPEDRTSIVLDRSQGGAFPNVNIDGTISETYNTDVLEALTGQQRGGFQTVSPGEQVAAFRLGETANGPLSTVVRLRERFTFQR